MGNDMAEARRRGEQLSTPLYSPYLARVIDRFKYEKSYLRTYPDFPRNSHHVLIWQLAQSGFRALHT